MNARDRIKALGALGICVRPFEPADRICAAQNASKGQGNAIRKERDELNDIDSVFQARMRALALKGGVVTKRRYGNDPRYYRNIGRLGGIASVAARKAKIAAELDGISTGEPPIVEAVAASFETPQPAPRPAMSPYRKVLADLGRPSPYTTPARNRWDIFAEEQIERLIAQMSQQDYKDYDEPFDELG